MIDTLVSFFVRRASEEIDGKVNRRNDELYKKMDDTGDDAFCITILSTKTLSIEIEKNDKMKLKKNNKKIIWTTTKIAGNFNLINFPILINMLPYGNFLLIRCFILYLLIFLNFFSIYNN